MYQMFLAKNDTEYVVHMERRREALISNQPACESNAVDRKPIISKHYYHDVFVNLNLTYTSNFLVLIPVIPVILWSWE